MRSLSSAGLETRQLTIGREDEAEICIEWDSEVSWLHAELRRAGGSWLVIDDGLSRNGTFVNGERVVGRRRLRDGDELRVGGTVLVFRSPGTQRRMSTAHAADLTLQPQLSPAQQRVLVALCRPYGDGDAFARPAPNKQIADELHLSVAAVKTHLRSLFQRFGVNELAQNEKRTELIRLAFESGAVSSADVRRPT
ncbi:MAG: FHA domain-containing protein [Thermoleophilaceae bacterium]|nr:FHA domain-containing protein [Thermoleophilaceae bacterium]